MVALLTLMSILVSAMVAVAPTAVTAQVPSATRLDHRSAWALALAHTGDIGAAVHYAEVHLRGVDLATALARIVDAQLQQGDLAGALRTAEKISTWGYSKTPKARALGAIAAAQAAAGDNDDSRRTFKEARGVARRLPASDIKGNSPQASVLESIALTEARAGDLDGALRTIDSIKRRSYKVDGLLAVARAQLEAGDRTGSERVLDRAAETARRLVVALASVAVAYHSSGTIEQADSVLAEAVRLADGMENSDDRKAWARRTIADAQARMTPPSTDSARPQRMEDQLRR